MQQHTYVVSLNNSGICNRLKGILSVLRLSTTLNYIPIVYWLPNDFTRCEFSDLFKNDIPVINTRDAYKKLVKNTRWREYRDFVEDYTSVDYIFLNTWRLLTLPGEIHAGFARACPSVNGNDIDFEFHRIPRATKDSYVKLIHGLRPIDYVANRVEDFARRLDSQTIAVSVRSWDETHDRSNLFAIQEFYHALDSYSDRPFYLSCDSPKVLEAFIARYGDRVIYFPKRTFAGDRNSSHGMQDILVDLYLLSKHRTLIGSYLSTFSEMVWWFGGCTAQVKIVGFRRHLSSEITRRDRKRRRLLFLKNHFYKKVLVTRDAFRRLNTVFGSSGV